MLKVKNKTFFLLFLMCSLFLSAQVDNAPQITAQGRQAFCVGNPINIVTDFTITDADDIGIEFFFIQISSGYQVGFDFLELVGNHPNIIPLWDVNEGKLTFISSGSGTEILFTDLENAVKDVVFTTSAITNITPEKSFSLSIDNANYLPLTDHFYEFVAEQGITWQNAKIAAENRTFFGRQGYLATLTSAEEAQFAGEQASGAGWIGGNDEESEGVWKWVTGPEAGTSMANFWNGEVNGSTPNYANWNNNEPNDAGSGGEDYAHITDPSIGIRGAWNDLPLIGGTGLYVPKGYIVEYGAPGDLPLSIVANTSIYIPQITSTTNAIICASGLATISAIPSEGEILWFDNSNIASQLELARGNDFTVSVTETTTFYATISLNGCITLPRVPVTIIVTQRPTITNVVNDIVCAGEAELFATASEGSVYWYESLTDTVPFFIGTNFTTPVLTGDKTYYVEANNANCNSDVRTEITAILDTTIPEFELESRRYALCEDVGFVELKTKNPLDNYTYQWFKDNELLTENSSSISVTISGEYKVKAISIAGCESDEKTIIVNDSQIATVTFDDLLIIENSFNNSIKVINDNLGNGEYEFSLDEEFSNYQDEGYFQNIIPGLHILFIRDKGGCGIAAFEFSILEYPLFFSPNNDGNNDTWSLKGFNEDFYTTIMITIFDRFGTAIFQIDENNTSWNGTFNGKDLPSNGYWFKANLIDKNGRVTEKNGNFSLVR